MDLRDAVESAPPAITKAGPPSMRSFAIGIGTIVIIAITLLTLIEGRRPVDVNGSDGTWGGTGGVQFWGGVARLEGEQGPTLQEILAQQRRDDYVQLESPDIQGEPSESADLVSLLGALVEPLQNGVTETVSSAYDFIPRGLISTVQQPSERTPLQKELYEYGNEIGGYLRTFEDSHVNMLSTLKDAREDLGNPDKADAAAQIGTDYRILARDLKEMSVPGSARALHDAFAEANVQVGTKLEAVARATNDQIFLESVDTYNKTVENYAEKFVALASLFAAAQVTFSESDPGSVFSFRGTVTGY